jgi:signal peptide peptidase SppA
MKKYPHIINRLFYEPLIVTHARHAAMCRVLESRLAQGMRDDDDEDEEDEEASADSPQKRPAPDWQTFGRDAVIPVHGTLVGHASDIPMSSCGCGCDDVAKMIDVAMVDSEVQKIIFDFRTPGGAVTGIPELARKIAGISGKTTVAFTDDECCSAGVWLASQCQYFYTTPSASVGSIGVWMACLDQSRHLANEGQNVQAISAGKYKLLGAFWKPLTDEERAMLQADVDKIYGQFKQAVTMQRSLKAEFMQGQIFDGETAVEIGLCDGLVECLEELLEQEDEN